MTYFKSVSPGIVETEFFGAAGMMKVGDKISDGYAALRAENISHAVMYLLSTPYTMNVTEMTVKPTGERF